MPKLSSVKNESSSEEKNFEQHDSLISVTAESSINFLADDYEGNLIEVMHNFFIKEEQGDPIPFDRSQKIVLFVQALGATAGVYAWPPAAEFAKGKPEWIALSIMITNPLSSVLFLTKATADFLNATIQDFTAPKQIANIISLPSAKELLNKYGKITAGSVICAIPFGILTYFYPLPGCNSKACLSVIVFHSWLSNTIMHALSWGFIMTPAFWYYRLPTLPFTSLYKKLRNYFLSDSEREYLSDIKELESIYNKYRIILSSKVISATENNVSFAWDAVKRHQYELSNSVLKEKTFVEFIRLGSMNESIGYQRSLLFSAKFFGAIFTMIGILGWILSPFYLASSTFGFGLWETLAFGILPAYTTIVLSTFFGQHIWEQIYTYFTSYNGLMSKLPVEAKYFPIPFTILTLCNCYISAFAYANGKQYIESTEFNLEIWQKSQPILANIAIPALILLSFIPLQDLNKAMLRGVNATVGESNNEKVKAMRLLSASTLFSGYLQKMDGKKMMKSLAQYSIADRKIILGMNASEFEVDYDTFHKKYQTIEQKKRFLTGKNHSYASGGNRNLMYRASSSNDNDNVQNRDSHYNENSLKRS